jgi:AraC-like DNA-binding protein
MVEGSGTGNSDDRPADGSVSGIRPAWLHALTQRCQSLVGDLHDERTLTRNRVRAALEALPRPKTRVEEYVFHGLLLDLAVGSGPSDMRSPGRRRTDALAGMILQLAESRWRGRTNAERAAAMIEWRANEPLSVPAIARVLKCHETTLRREFREVFGISMREYQVRHRVREAVRHLSHAAGKIGAIGRLVGYKSEKNFYRALRRVTGFSPGQIARMSPDERIDLLARLSTSLPR